ncbi:hypothetical protein CFOL_v3_17497 [Cephalotus follicularis]|uniref:Uncharacterized protein n=1 Tax=Cephalotus follicularis TaxID=3775 RepID=A0A1Q3C174_CEPFO|nr:hypothetical protein CFOL_v3_17497 [Cephalotus follicularis]
MPRVNPILELIKFPQPTRPINASSPKLCYNKNFDSCTPKERVLHQFRDSNSVQFPQPARPINSMSPKYWMSQNRVTYRFEDLGPVQSPRPSTPYSTFNNVSYPYYVPDDTYSRESFYRDNVPVTPRLTGKKESEVVDEIIRGISELNKKLPTRLGGQVKLDDLNINVTSTIQRGLNVSSTSPLGLQRPVDKLPNKLERFKIRTINLGGVVKEEEEHKC